jgi:hypothetical protein
VIVNNYFKSKLDSCSVIDSMPDSLKKSLMKDVEEMSSQGIESEEDERKFAVLNITLPSLIWNMYGRKFPGNFIRLVCSEVFRNKDKYPIDSILGLMEGVHFALNRMLPDELRVKLAYPQAVAPIMPRPEYNLDSWVKATRGVYDLTQQGYSPQQAVQEVTKDWDNGERMNYQHWLKFYEERGPEKYPKTASVWDGPAPAFLKAKLPNPSERRLDLPGHVQMDSSFADDVNDVRDTIEQQRKKLIGRLNSAEKLLSSMEGQLFAGNDQELMLKMLQDLKRRIQTSNKRSVRSSLFEDFIYRTANYLQENGKSNAAGFFYKIAQLPDLDLDLPPPGGDMGEPPGLGGSPPMGGPEDGGGGGAEEETIKLIEEFFNNLKRGVHDPRDSERDKKDKKSKDKEASYMHDIIVTAQDVTPELPDVPNFPEEANPLVPDSADETEKTDDVIEAALGNISINDVISRLEDLVAIYNQREISRQLAILDIMMDKLGLSSYFPSLGEAQGKALEANQYISTRISDILTKLKGSVETPGIDQWVGGTGDDNQETAALRQSLEQEQAVEDRRKDLRKKKELAKLEGGGADEGIPMEEIAPEPAPVETPSPEVPQMNIPEVPPANEPTRPSRVERSRPIRTR